MKSKILISMLLLIILATIIGCSSTSTMDSKQLWLWGYGFNN